MARDIEEFLRRAAERRQQQKGGGQPKPPSRQQPPQQTRKPIRQQRPLEPTIVEPTIVEPTIVEPTIVSAEIVEAVPSSRRRATPPQKTSLREQSVADHVRSHIDTSRIASHAEQLGDRIADIKDRVETNVHRRLDHDITALDDKSSITDTLPSDIFGKPTDQFAEELRQMLRDQRTVGKAIILAEILKRPDF